MPNVRLKVIEDGEVLYTLTRREMMCIVVTTAIEVLRVSASTTTMRATGHGKEKEDWEEELRFAVDGR